MRISVPESTAGNAEPALRRKMYAAAGFFRRLHRFFPAHACATGAKAV